MESWIARRLAVGSIAWLGFGITVVCSPFPCTTHKPKCADCAGKEKDECSDSNNERDSIRDRPRFKAARAQKVFVVKGLVRCAGKPDEKNPRGEGIKTGD